MISARLLSHAVLISLLVLLLVVFPRMAFAQEYSTTFVPEPTGFVGGTNEGCNDPTHVRKILIRTSGMYVGNFSSYNAAVHAGHAAKWPINPDALGPWQGIWYQVGLDWRTDPNTSGGWFDIVVGNDGINCVDPAVEPFTDPATTPEEPQPPDCSTFQGQFVNQLWDYGGGSVPPAPDCLGDMDGYGCAAAGSSAITSCIGDHCFSVLEYTGDHCTVPASGAVEPSADPVTCVTMGGDRHCWSNDDPNCQYVNGERWCQDDVAVGPVITAQGQVLADGSTPVVVDDLGDPVPPDSTVAGSVTNVEHHNSETVNNNNLSGPVAGNTAQSGSGVPGAGASGDGGPGDGAGDGEGEGEEPGTFSGGGDCSAPPSCTGDPLLCGIAQQQWKARCVDAISDADIASQLGLPAGTTEETAIAALAESSEGDGWAISQTFNDYFTAQGGDWWSRPTVCITDPVINLPASFGVGALTIPLSEWCGILMLIGQLVLVGSWVQALRIIVGAV